jgi:integrase/recombinase XerD
MQDFEKNLTNWLHYLETQKGCAPTTLREYRRDLDVFYRHLVGPGDDHLPSLQAEHGQVTTTADVDHRHLSAYLVHLKHQHQISNSTLTRKIASLKSFFHWLTRAYVITTDPAADLSVPAVQERIPEDLSEPQVEQLLDVIPTDDWISTRDWAIVQVLLNTGLRVGELVDLDLPHVDLMRDEVRVLGKGGHQRVVPLNRIAKKAILDWLDRREGLGPPDTDALFLTRRSRRRLSSRAVQMMVEKYAQEAGLDNVTPHTFRHTFGTRLLERGASLREVQELLGHKSVTTTQRYTHVNQARLHKAVHRLAQTATDLLES